HARHEGGCHQESTVEIDRKDLAPIGEGHVEEIFFCGKMPAQFTTISTCPNLPCTCFAIAATPVSEDTSQFTASACRPVASTNFTVSWPSVRSAIATCTPSSANRLAKACPMPLAPPVITATLSLWPFCHIGPRFLPVTGPKREWPGQARP